MKMIEMANLIADLVAIHGREDAKLHFIEIAKVENIDYNQYDDIHEILHILKDRNIKRKLIMENL